MRNKRLKLSKTDKLVGGVCGGLGEYFNIDPTIIRILFCVFLGGDFWLYLLLWMIMGAAVDSSNDDVVQGQVDEQKDF